jgi:hypothetical protein
VDAETQFRTRADPWDDAGIKHRAADDAIELGLKLALRSGAVDARGAAGVTGASLIIGAVLGREFPARPIRGDIEPVPYPEMAPKD